MTEEERKDLDELNLLIKAVRYNHNKEDGKFNVLVNPDDEIERYQNGITQLTLPARFKMLKTPKTTPKVTQVELEDPDVQLDSTSQGNPDPNHKRRDIFG